MDRIISPEARVLNFFSEDLRRNPFPVYEHLRNASPVLYHPSSDAWLIFDHTGVKQSLTDHESFSSSLFKAGRPNPQWWGFFDPPRHTKLRALIMRAFSPRAVADLEPRIRDLSRGPLESALKSDEFDFAADFSVPLPMMVIAELIGIPPSDWPRFRRWSETILKMSFSVIGGEEAAKADAEIQATSTEMKDYVSEQIAQRRSIPHNDLLTGLVQAEVDGERLTPEDILGFVKVLLVAGNETTTNLPTTRSCA